MPTTTPFFIAAWLGPPRAEITPSRIAEVAGAGFDVASTPIDGASPEDSRRLLDLCEAAGLRALLVDGRLALDGDGTLEKRVAAVDADFGDHPALFGLVIDDEPARARFDELAEISRAMLARRPTLLPIVCVLPNFALREQLGTPTYREYVEAWLDVAQPPIFIFDHYALMEEGIRPELFDNLEIVRDACGARGVPWAMAINAVKHIDYRQPTEADLRWQSYAALAHGASGIVYYTYWTPPLGFEPPYEYGDAVIARDGSRSPTYAAAARANADVRSLASQLAGLRSTDVYHCGPVPAGARGVRAGDPVQVQSDGPVLVGLFGDGGASTAAVVVNRDPDAAHDVRLSFAGGGATDLRSGEPVAASMRLDAGDAIGIRLPG